MKQLTEAMLLKVGLLQLAKLEVISQCIIFPKTKNSTLDNLLSNFDNPYLHSNWQFEHIRKFLSDTDINLNTTKSNEDVTAVERFIRTK